MKIKTLSSRLLILGIILLIIVPIPIFSQKATKEFELEIAEQPTRNWTYMLYLCGDTRDDVVSQALNNSDVFPNGYLKGVINSLVNTDILPGSESEINIIALFDEAYTIEYTKGHAELLKLEANNKTVLANYGETNMGSAATLSNFISYCKTNFPADNYALTLSDHGRGYAGSCYDYHAPHPYWQYALGDCLSVEEIEQALANNGGVDVLFMDVCLGGSFELLWQLEDEAHYVSAGETSQGGRGLFRPRDVLWHLTRNVSLIPLSVAMEGFRSAQNPVLYPKNEDEPYPFTWHTVGVYDLDQFSIAPGPDRQSLKDVFNEFTFYLFDELGYNITNAREVFADIRSKFEYTNSIFYSNSLMVDVSDLVVKILNYSHLLHNQVELELYGTQLLEQLEPSWPSTGNTIIQHWNAPLYQDENFTGFSICFPDSLDMYRGFLYPYLYNNMDISSDTYWDDFIFNLYPPNEVLFKLPKLEYYEFYLDKIDPTVHLHVYIQDEPFELPLHIGYTSTENANVGMSVEIGVEGASFQDTLLHGTTMIQVPVASIPSLTKDTVKNIQVVVNASTAASTVKDVNLTVRHVDSTGVIWQATKISDIEIGQIISTNVTTNDQWTDWEELAPPANTSRFTGYGAPITLLSITITFTMIIVLQKKRTNSD